MPSEELRIGVDLGGTKTEAVVVRLGPREADGSFNEQHDVLVRRRIPTEREGGYDHIVERTVALVHDVAREAGRRLDRLPVGVGLPGSFTFRRRDGSASTTPLVKNANTVCLNGMPFKRDLETRLGVPLAMANDANCFALAEAAWGAARSARVSFGVIWGTGVGGGIVLRHPGRGLEVWEGAQSIAGEWGHVTLDPVSGPPCYCGRRGCIEALLAGPAIERRYQERTGRGLSVEAIAAAARAGTDPAATSLLAETLELFGRAMATVINIVDPDVVVLGGGVSNLEEIYEAGKAAVDRWVFNDVPTVRLEKHRLGDSAGVLGATLLPDGNGPHRP